MMVNSSNGCTRVGLIVLWVNWRIHPNVCTHTNSPLTCDQSDVLLCLCTGPAHMRADVAAFHHQLTAQMWSSPCRLWMCRHAAGEGPSATSNSLLSLQNNHNSLKAEPVKSPKSGFDITTSNTGTIWRTCEDASKFDQMSKLKTLKPLLFSECSQRRLPPRPLIRPN